MSEDTYREPDTVVFNTEVSHEYIVTRGNLEATKEGDERIVGIDLYAEGEYVVTYTLDDGIEVEVDRRLIVEAAEAADMFVPWDA